MSKPEPKERNRQFLVTAIAIALVEIPQILAAYITLAEKLPFLPKPAIAEVIQKTPPR